MTMSYAAYGTAHLQRTSSLRHMLAVYMRQLRSSISVRDSNAARRRSSSLLR